jgi:hypothetical protein
VTPGYRYHDAQGREQHQPDDHSKAKEWCGCGQVGKLVVHGADGAWLMCEPCYQRLLGILGRQA